jgi:hypothetical protein
VAVYSTLFALRLAFLWLPPSQTRFKTNHAPCHYLGIAFTMLVRTFFYSFLAFAASAQDTCEPFQTDELSCLKALDYGCNCESPPNVINYDCVINYVALHVKVTLPSPPTPPSPSLLLLFHFLFPVTFSCSLLSFFLLLLPLLSTRVCVKGCSWPLLQFCRRAETPPWRVCLRQCYT